MSTAVIDALNLDDTFRTSIHGFKKEDVITYIDNLQRTHDDEVASLQEMILDLRKQNATLKNNANVMSEKYNDMVKKLHEIQSNSNSEELAVVTDPRDQILEASNVNTKSDDESYKLQIKLSKLTDEKETLQRQLATLQRQMQAQTSQQTSDMQSAKKASNEELFKVQNDLKRAVEENATLKRRVASLESQVEEINEGSAAKQGEYDEYIRKAIDKIQTLRNKVKDQSEAIKKYEELAKLGNVSELNNELVNMKKIHETDQNKNDALQAQVKYETERNQELHKELEIRDKNIWDLHLEVKRLLKYQEALKGEVNKLYDEKITWINEFE